MNRASHRHHALALTVAFAVLAAACGSDTDETSAPTQPSTTPGSTTEPAATGPTTTFAATITAEPTTTEPPAEFDSAVEYPRTVVHALGEFTQDAPPEQVFIGSSEIFGEAMIALGVTPSGRLDWFGGAPVPVDDDYGLDVLDEVPVLGTVFAPDLEVIVGAEPDVVLVFSGFGNAIHDQLLGQIDVYAVDIAADWREALIGTGDAIGRPERAEAVLAEYDLRLDEIADSEMAEFFAGRSTAVITPLGGAGAILVPGDIIGDAMDRAGVPLWEPGPGFEGSGPDDAADGIVNFSKELAGEIDADVVVIVLEDEGGLTPTREAFVADPVWGSIPAIVEGDVFFVRNNILRNAGPLTHYLFFDDLAAAVANAG
ncbi:MAG: ABC transporter substrate-binding protein [Actinomycetota bacterium]